MAASRLSFTGTRLSAKLDGELARLATLLLGAAADVLHLGLGAQEGVGHLGVPGLQPASWASDRGPGGLGSMRRPACRGGRVWSLFDMTVRNELSRRPYGRPPRFQEGCSRKNAGRYTHCTAGEVAQEGRLLTMRTPRTEAAAFTSAITSAA